MSEDKRKEGLKDGLRQLTVEQLERVLSYEGEMVLDTVNYDEDKKTFCPLAIGLELDKVMENPTHKKVFDKLMEMGYKVNNTKGISGNFYRKNRKEDLNIAANEVLKEWELKKD